MGRDREHKRKAREFIRATLKQKKRKSLGKGKAKGRGEKSSPVSSCEADRDKKGVTGIIPRGWYPTSRKSFLMTVASREAMSQGLKGDSLMDT